MVQGVARRQAARAQQAMMSPSVQQSTLGLLVLTAVLWGSLVAWRFYSVELRPLARPVAIPTPPRIVRADDEAETKRWQMVTNLLGEAISDIAAKHYDWADDALRRVFDLDPGNPDALSLLRQLALVPEASPSPEQAAARRRQIQVQELLGQAAALIAAKQAGTAQPLLEQALALDPQNGAARRLLEQATCAACPTPGVQPSASPGSRPPSAG